MSTYHDKKDLKRKLAELSDDEDEGTFKAPSPLRKRRATSPATSASEHRIQAANAGSSGQENAVEAGAQYAEPDDAHDGDESSDTLSATSVGNDPDDAWPATLEEGDDMILDDRFGSTETLPAAETSVMTDEGDETLFDDDEVSMTIDGLFGSLERLTLTETLAIMDDPFGYMLGVELQEELAGMAPAWFNRYLIHSAASMQLVWLVEEAYYISEWLLLDF